MHTFGRRVALRVVVLLGVIVLPSAPALAQHPIGMVTTLDGTATVTRAGAPSSVSLKFKDPVFLGDRVTTDQASLVKMLLGGKALLTMRDLSSLAIGTIDGPPSLALDTGRIAVATRKLQLGDAVEIRTSNAIAQVRGSLIVVEVLGAVTHIDCGAGDCRGGLLGGPLVQIPPLQGLTISGDVLGPLRPIRPPGPQMPSLGRQLPGGGAQMPGAIPVPGAIPNPVTSNSRACDGGAPRACTKLGALYERGLSGPNSPALAAAAYLRGCNGSDPEGCEKLAAMYQRGLGVAKDLAQAAAFRGRGCDLGDGAACATLAAMYETGTGVTTDPQRAADLYRRATESLRRSCGSGDGGACANLGAMYETGTGAAPDRKLASDLYKRACELGVQSSCPPGQAMPKPVPPIAPGTHFGGDLGQRILPSNPKSGVDVP